MSMLPKKSPSAFPPFEGDEELARLTQRCSEIRVRRGDVHETIIAVEKSSPTAQLDVNAALYAERDALDRALKIGESRIHILATARAERIWAGYFSEIAEIEKRRVMLVCELQRTNRAREKLRTKITKSGGAGFLATDGVEFLGFGDEYAEIKWAANRLVADGIATVAEIEKARSDG